MLSMGERDAIKARCEAATPGPWKRPGVIPTHEDRTQADAIFIAHARQDIPALLAALKEYDEGDIFNQAITDRDHWQKRAEALERALREYDGCNGCIRCDNNYSSCCGLWHECRGQKNYQFDYERFAKEE